MAFNFEEMETVIQFHISHTRDMCNEKVKIRANEADQDARADEKFFQRPE